MEEQKPACLFPCLSHLFPNAQARHAVHVVRKGQMGQGDGSSPSNPQVAQTVQFGELALLCANYLALSTTPAGQRNSPGSQGSLCGLPALTDPASLKPQQLERQELTPGADKLGAPRERSNADSHRPGRCEEHTWLQCFTLLTWLSAPPFSINSVCTWISVTG